MTRRDAGAGLGAARGSGAARLGGAGRVADALRSAPPALDELTRARMERRLLEAPSDRGALDRGGSASDRSSRIAPRLDRRGRAAWAAGGALIAAAAALAIGWIVWPRDGASGAEGPVARFTIDGPGAGARGEVRVGGSLEVGAGEHASVQVGHAEIALVGAEGASSGRGMVRFASLDTRDVRLELTSGQVDVAFHPVERGSEHLTIETPSARVEVVGTVFSVRIEGSATRVAVREGVVRVVPHGADDSAVLVRAGESVAVREGGAARVESAAEADPVAVAETEAAAVAETEAAIPGAAIPEAATEADVRRARVRPASEVSPPVVAETGAGTEAPGAEYDPAPAEVPPPEVTVVSAGSRLAAGRTQVEDGRHRAGRATLAAVVRDRSAPIAVRVEAQTSIGDSLLREGELTGAAAAYEEAARLGDGLDEGANAIFALARLYARQRRPDDARRTYLRYLYEHPLGSNRRDARDWICAHGGDPSVECGAQ